jgi:hypothetical protein
MCFPLEENHSSSTKSGRFPHDRAPTKVGSVVSSDPSNSVSLAIYEGLNAHSIRHPQRLKHLLRNSTHHSPDRAQHSQYRLGHPFDQQE